MRSPLFRSVRSKVDVSWSPAPSSSSACPCSVTLTSHSGARSAGRYGDAQGLAGGLRKDKEDTEAMIAHLWEWLRGAAVRQDQPGIGVTSL